MKSTLIIIIVVTVIFYYFISGIKEQLNRVTTTQETLITMYGKMSELQQSKQYFEKVRANIEAFRGFECSKCHVQTELLLPLARNQFIKEAEYIQKVRHAPVGMPSYPHDIITDAALKMQYRIIMNLKSK